MFYFYFDSLKIVCTITLLNKKESNLEWIYKEKLDTINLISVKQDLVLKIYTQENKSQKEKEFDIKDNMRNYAFLAPQN